LFRIIAIEREYGCGAGVIASKLAGRLGWKLWDQAMTDEIAKLAHVSRSAVEQHQERVDSTFYRLSKVFWRGSYERSLPVADVETFDCDAMVRLVQQVVETAAASGNCILVGRGSPYFLRNRPDTFSVFLYAARDEKIRRLAAIGKPPEEAAQLVDSVDQERITFVKHYFGADWPSRSLYQMMLNTGIGDETVIATILHGLRSIEIPAPSSFK
jgi:cytidylate kinase